MRASALQPKQDVSDFDHSSRNRTWADPPEQCMSISPDLGPKPRLGYSASRIDRAAERRGEAPALERDPSARAYAIGGEFVVLKKNGEAFDPLFTLAEARSLGEAVEVVFLGLFEGAARFAVGMAPASIETLKSDERFAVIDLRSIAVRGLIEPDHLPPVAEGKAVLNWHARHRFCPNCGAPSTPVEGGWRRDCASCRTQHFPRTDPVAIMLAVAGERCLLGRSHRFAPGMWSCLAGYVEPGESIEDAVRRETLEEAGIACGRVVYFASQPWPFPTSLMIGCHAEALSHAIAIDRTELDDARWFDRDEVALMLLRRHPDGLTAPYPVAIAHHIIRDWVENGAAFG
jgi:NAD+ diphosphatase